MSRFKCRILGGVAASTAVVLGVVGPAARAIGQPVTTQRAESSLHHAVAPFRDASTERVGDFPVKPLSSDESARAMRQSALGLTIPLWTGSATHQGVTYHYHMVGKNPFVHQRHPRVIIDVPVISAVLHFPDGTTSDPTKPTGCGTSTSLSPTDLVAGSPIFKRRNYTIGGVFVGRGQYVNEFQRANFWDAIQASNNQHYEVRLRPSFVTVSLSPTQTALFNPITETLSCGHLWGLDAFAVDNYIQQTLIPSLRLPPTSFPIFLGSDIYGYVGGLCCVLGSHSKFMNDHGLLQTYAEVDYDTVGFGGSPDVAVLSHEVGEWMDDPFNDNVQPCVDLGLAAFPAPSNGLEVGDPLVGTDVTVGPMPDGVTYHPQELAFLSYFYDQVPSQAVNPGWYSSNGTFTRPGCPAT